MRIHNLFNIKLLSQNAVLIHLKKKYILITNIEIRNPINHYNYL